MASITSRYQEQIACKKPISMIGRCISTIISCFICFTYAFTILHSLRSSPANLNFPPHPKKLWLGQGHRRQFMLSVVSARFSDPLLATASSSVQSIQVLFKGTQQKSPISPSLENVLIAEGGAGGLVIHRHLLSKANA